MADCDHPPDALTGFDQKGRSEDGSTIRFRAFCESCTERVLVEVNVISVERVQD